MSTLKQPETAAAEITEEAIASYLQSHPEFFERHLTLLSGLRLPHRTGGPAVSLVERQVTVLRQRNMKLERKLRELIEIARGNDALAAKIHELARLLLAARTREQVIDALEYQLRLSFNADEAVLVLFDAAPPGNVDEQRFLRRLPRDAAELAPFRTFLESRNPRCGQVRDTQRDFLFGPGNIEIGSVAMVPIGENCRLGFLAIGSRNAEHFHPGKSIDFLVRLGEMVHSALDER